jgi:hypothetical protein
MNNAAAATLGRAEAGNLADRQTAGAEWLNSRMRPWLESVATPTFLPSVLHAPAQKGEVRGVYKRFFPRGLFQQRESGRYHLTGTMVRCTDGFRIFKMKRVQIRRDEGPEGLAG